MNKIRYQNIIKVAPLIVVFVFMFIVLASVSSYDAYAESETIEIVFEYDGIHAGSQVPLSVFVDGSSASGDIVTWTVSGNLSEKTLILTDKMTYPGGSTKGMSGISW